jgi:hypothetical protein
VTSSAQASLAAGSFAPSWERTPARLAETDRVKLLARRDRADRCVRLLRRAVDCNGSDSLGQSARWADDIAAGPDVAVHFHPDRGGGSGINRCFWTAGDGELDRGDRRLVPQPTKPWSPRASLLQLFDERNQPRRADLPHAGTGAVDAEPRIAPEVDGPRDDLGASAAENAGAVHPHVAVGSIRSPRSRSNRNRRSRCSRGSPRSGPRTSAHPNGSQRLDGSSSSRRRTSS